MKREEVKSLLFDAADLTYKEFNDKITNCNTAPSIGIRVPRLREIAAEIVKQGWEEYLEEMEGAGTWNLFQEEHMLQGMVIGKARMKDEERIRHLEQWIPGIMSWADCDCCVSSFKFMKKNQNFWFDYNTRWLGGWKEFELRYGIVALMQYFINETYIDRVLEIFKADYPSSAPEPDDRAVNLPGEGMQASSYYVKMAQAWALSVCFVKFRDKTWKVFEEKKMDSWVQNKAIQKCRESYRVSDEDKELLKALRM